MTIAAELTLTNSYRDLPAACYAEASPQGASAPQLIAWNAPLADRLGIGALSDDPAAIVALFSGNRLPPDLQPIALAYAGHQFGHFTPQLGDGRALLLGELKLDARRPVDIQLKGSGRTPFSRGGDGRSAIGPVVREYLVSEAMHVLGVPTTRALAAIATGEPVIREQMLPGGILTRVAASHLRIGTLQFFAARGASDVIARLVDYALMRHYPDVRGEARPALALFERVLDAQARLVAQWMALGFIHGVMNTDNMSLSGETIDYGPCAFLDEFRHDKVFSAIDRGGRYAYDQQPAIAQWNLARLAESLLLVHDDVDAFETQLAEFESRYQRHYLDLMRAKLGLRTARDGDAQLISDWLDGLHDGEHDYTQSHRRLIAALDGQPHGLSVTLVERWRARIAQDGDDPDAARNLMQASNPIVIPRNHQIERAISAAEQGDFAPFHALHNALSSPFDVALEGSDYAAPPRPEERVARTFCGT